MCGVFGAILPENSEASAAEQVLAGLKTLEYRGYDSWGVGWVDPTQALNQKVHIKKAVGKIGQAHLPQTSSLVALGHTRWATHGGVTQANAHPHTDCTQKIVLVHNGIVENYQALRASLHESHRFSSETDTEIIAHFLEEKREKLSTKDAILAVFSELEGLNAIVVLDAETQELFAIRKGSPLIVARSEYGVFVTSDTVALAPYKSEIAYLPENILVHFSQQEIRACAINGSRVELIWKKLELKEEDTELGDYQHFLEKEIHQQPAVLRQMAGRLPDVQTFYKLLSKSPAIHLVGCGTAYHACLSATYSFAQYGKLAHATLGSEFGARKNVIPESDSIVFVSQSGETIDLIEHAQSLHAHKKMYAMINRPDSSLSRLVRDTFLLQAGIEQCVLATKSFTAQMAAWWAVSAFAKKSSQKIAEQLQATALAVDTVLNDPTITEKIQQVVALLDTSEHCFSLGRGALYPIALEAALKIKEVTYLHTEGFAGGELKHGTMALISPGTPCLVFVQNDAEKNAMLSNAQEIKSRGAIIIGIGTENNEIFDHFFTVPDVGELTSIPLSVVGQLIAYRLACKRGLDPDKPRNIAKSVVVK